MFLFDFSSGINFVFVAFVVVDDSSVTYDILYWLEKAFRSHSVFNWEAVENCGDTLYLRKRKSYAWMKWYGKKTLPLSDWDE